MSIFVAILGLAFLILIHEAGHFFAALAVGMRPRKFYLGFPPALVKTTRGGDRVRHRRDPARRLREDPRDAPAGAGGTSTSHFGRALERAPELVGPVERLKRALAAGDDDGARAALDELDAALAATSRRPASTRRAARRSRDALCARRVLAAARRGSRIAVIVAGPGDEPRSSRSSSSRSSSWSAAARRRRRSTQVLPKHAGRARSGCSAGRPDRRDQRRRRSTPTDISTRDLGLAGQAAHAARCSATAAIVTLGPVAPEQDRRRLPARLRRCSGEEPRPAAASAWQSREADRRSSRGTSARRSAHLVHGQGRKDISSPVGIVQGSTDGGRSREPETTSGCSG